VVGQAPALKSLKSLLGFLATWNRNGKAVTQWQQSLDVQQNSDLYLIYVISSIPTYETWEHPKKYSDII
jgi:hypothetical protein